MEELPNHVLVLLLGHLPRASLFNVAQVSRTLLAATEDDRLWGAGVGVPSPIGGGGNNAKGLFEPEGLRGSSSSSAVADGDFIRNTVARWVGSLLRVPWQSLVPLIRFELGNTSGSSKFHLKISLHPIRAVLGSSEVGLALTPGAASDVALALRGLSDWLHGPRTWPSSIEPCFDCKK
jgi:hypothetical protein